MIWGYVCLFICIFLLMKYVARKLKWGQFERILRKAHIPFGIVCCAVVIIHFIVTLKVWQTRHFVVIVSGIIATLLIGGMAWTYYQRKKLGRRWLVLHKWYAALCVVMILLHIGSYFMDFFSYQAQVMSLSVQTVDLSKVKDGTYIGTCDVGYIYAKVEVVVKQGAIEKVTLLEHHNERGKRAELLISEIVTQQNVKVDTVTGATNSSLVIEKAVANALSE